MRTKVLTTALLVFCSFAVCLAAITGLNGKWKGTVKIADDNVLDLTYNFRVDGDKLSGSVQSPDGEDLPIADGVLQGNEFAFKVTVGKINILHTGKYYGDSVTVAADLNGKTFRSTLKRSDK